METASGHRHPQLHAGNLAGRPGQLRHENESPTRSPYVDVKASTARDTALDVWAFALPALSWVEIGVVGNLRASELIAVVLLPWILSRADRVRLPRWFLILWIGWLASQVLTDVAVGSAFADFSRGWARIGVTMTSLVATLGLVSSAKR